MQEYQKKIIIIGIVLIICTLLFGSLKMLSIYNNTDKEQYGSLDEILEIYFPNSNYETMQSDDYYYIVAEKEGIFQEKLIYKNNEGKFLIFNNWHDETRDAEHHFHITDIEHIDFYSYIRIDLNKGKCIISIERFFINDERNEEIIYDNYGDWQTIEVSGRAYYFKVLDENLIQEDYEITLKFNDRAISLITYENLFD